MNKNKVWVGFGAAFIMTMYAGSAAAGEITACAAKSTGSLRLATKCKKSERALVFNSAGAQGAQGPQGAPGPEGKQGSGAVLKAYDGKNQLLGTVATAYETGIVLYDAAGNGMLRISKSRDYSGAAGDVGLATWDRGSLDYLGENCTSPVVRISTGYNSWCGSEPYCGGTEISSSNWMKSTLPPNDLEGWVLFPSPYSEFAYDATQKESVPTGRIVKLGAQADHQSNDTAAGFFVPTAVVKSTMDSQGNCKNLTVTTAPAELTSPQPTQVCTGPNDTPSCTYKYTYKGITYDNSDAAWALYRADVTAYNEQMQLYENYIGVNYLGPKQHRWLFELATTTVPFNLPIQGPITLK